MSGKISHSIKKREKPNDVFITPMILAKKQIDMISLCILNLKVCISSILHY